MFPVHDEQVGLQFPQSLAEKYRPATIDGFIGLDKVRKTISNFAQRPSAPFAWLFKGPSGVGKSSLALALSNQLGAEFHHIPSQKCTVQNIDDVIRMCWYLPRKAGGFHLVLVDEADRMSQAAQLALLSKLDSTDPPPMTIFVFTCNSTEGLEKRFLSRTHELEFSSYGMREALALFLAKVWNLETGRTEGPDFAREVLKDGCKLLRERKSEPGQYDCKDAFTGQRRGWFYLDSFSASAIVLVHDALNDVNRPKFAGLSIQKMAKVAFRFVKVGA